MVKKLMELGTILDNLKDSNKYNNDKTNLFDYRNFMNAVYVAFDN